MTLPQIASFIADEKMTFLGFEADFEFVSNLRSPVS